MYVRTRLEDAALPGKPRSAEPQRDSACKYRSRVGVSFVGFFAELFRTPVNSLETTSVDLTECTDHSAAARRAVCRLPDFFSPEIPRLEQEFRPTEIPSSLRYRGARNNSPLAASPYASSMSRAQCEEELLDLLNCKYSV